MIMGVENLILQMKNTVLAYSPDQLAHVAAHALKFAQQCGATQAAVEVSEGSGLSVSVRHGEVETLEHTRDKGMGRMCLEMGGDGLANGRPGISQRAGHLNGLPARKLGHVKRDLAGHGVGRGQLPGLGARTAAAA